MALFAALAWPFPSYAQDLIITTGHYDLAVTYEPESGWRTYIHEFETGVELPVATTIYRLGDNARTEIPSNSDFALLGPAGDPVWILPEIFDADIVFLGLGAPLLGRNIFAGGLSNRGQITMRLLAVTGSGPDHGGHVTMWQSGFPPRFFFSSADGIDSSDALEAITANFHAHYNWAFTAPGLYRMTFEYVGELRPALGGEVTSTTITYTFEVGQNPDVSPLRYAWPLDDGWSWSSWMGYHDASYAPWVWDFHHGWIFLAPGEPDNFNLWTFQHGWVWSNQTFYPWLWDASNGVWLQPE